MPHYLVRLFVADQGASSAPVERRVEAPDRQSLAQRLGVLPQHVLDVQELDNDPIAQPLTRRRFPLQLFSQELAVLLDSGIALL
ncbi:MAG TPA: hypothetical protein VGE47_01360, partial [Burkholderiaceae bacterium]